MNRIQLRTTFLSCITATLLYACGGGGDNPVVEPLGTINQIPSADSNSLVTDEDSPLTIELSGSDSDGTIASFEIVTQPENGSLSSNGSRQIYTPDENFNGNDSFEFRVTDNNGVASNVAVISLVVDSVNDVPVITSNNSVNVTDNISDPVYSVVANDVDQDILNYKIIGGADASLFSIDDMSGQLAFISAPQFDNPEDGNQDNVYEIQLSVSDGQIDSLPIILVVSVIQHSQSSQNLISLIYPAQGSNIGGISGTITVLGKLNEDVFNGNLSQDIAAVEVNGVAAVLSSGNKNWQAEIPVSPGQLNLDVVVMLVDNSSILETGIAQNSPVLGSPAALAIQNNSLYFLDSTFNRLLSYELGSGELTLVSSNTEHSGPDFSNPNSISVDNTAQNAFLTDGLMDSIFVVDLATGERRILSSDSVGSGPSFNEPRASAFDPTSGQLIVVDALARAILAVDMVTGNRKIVSDSVTGTGENYGLPFGIVMDAQNNRVLVTDIPRKALIAVDLTTGNRTVISGATTGTGEEFSLAQHITLDSLNNRAFVSDVTDGRVIEVNLATGDRTLFTSSNVANDDLFEQPGALVVDSGRNRLLVADPKMMSVLEVALDTANLNTLVSTRVGTGLHLSGPSAIELDKQSSRALLIDSRLNSLIEIDLNTGDRTTISNENVGTGDNFVLPFDMALDPVNDIAYVTDSSLNVIHSVDLTTGNRSIIFTNTNGMVGNVDNLIIDKINGRLLFTDSVLNSVFAYSLASNLLVSISDDNIGSGPEINAPRGLALDSVNQRVLTLNLRDKPAELISIDLITGDRTLISSSSRGAGPNITAPVDVSIDSKNNRAIVAQRNSLISVDLTSGDRTIISSVEKGVGTNLIGVANITFDVDNQTVLATDDDVNAVFLIDSNTGHRAIISK